MGLSFSFPFYLPTWVSNQVELKLGLSVHILVLTVSVVLLKHNFSNGPEADVKNSFAKEIT